MPGYRGGPRGGGPRGGGPRGGFGGPRGGFGGPRGGLGGPRGPRGPHGPGHMPPPPPHRHHHHRPYGHGYGCMGCLMPVIAAATLLLGGIAALLAYLL